MQTNLLLDEWAKPSEVEAEVETRMHLLKFHSNMIKKWRQGILYYSYIHDLKPINEEMKKAIDRFARGIYEPYHVMYSDADSRGRILYVLCVYYDKSDWEWNREQLTTEIELPCDVIYMDEKKHEEGTVLLTSIAEEALIPGSRLPITVNPTEEFFPDFRNAWHSLKSFFEKRF